MPDFLIVAGVFLGLGITVVGVKRRNTWLQWTGVGVMLAVVFTVGTTR